MAESTIRPGKGSLDAAKTQSARDKAILASVRAADERRRTIKAFHDVAKAEVESLRQRGVQHGVVDSRGSTQSTTQPRQAQAPNSAQASSAAFTKTVGTTTASVVGGKQVDTAAINNSVLVGAAAAVLAAKAVHDGVAKASAAAVNAASDAASRRKAETRKHTSAAEAAAKRRDAISAAAKSGDVRSADALNRAVAAKVLEGRAEVERLGHVAEGAHLRRDSAGFVEATRDQQAAVRGLRADEMTLQANAPNQTFTIAGETVSTTQSGASSAPVSAPAAPSSTSTVSTRFGSVTSGSSTSRSR